MIRKIIVFSFLMIFLSCNRKNKEFEHIEGEWNIQKFEYNNENILDRSLDPNDSDFYVAPYFYVFLDSNAFFIEVDAYNEIFYKANFKIEIYDNEILLKVIKSNNPKLMGVYKVKVDTVKTRYNDGNTILKMVLKSDKTEIQVRKTIVNSFIK